MNILDYILCAVIAVLVVFAVRSTIRRRKSGKDCSGDCSQCGNSCHGSTKK